MEKKRFLKLFLIAAVTIAIWNLSLIHISDKTGIWWQYYGSDSDTQTSAAVLYSEI